jgi:hypothetical protein
MIHLPEVEADRPTFYVNQLPGSAFSIMRRTRADQRARATPRENRMRPLRRAGRRGD